MRARTRILLAAGVGLFALFRSFRKAVADEDRPAMIVRGGSLIFQSGDETASERGRPWREVRRGRWTPHQPQGRPANHMVLTVAPRHGCDVRRQAVTDIRIRYFGTAGLETFQITSVNGHAPVRIPVLIGDGLSTGESGDYPTVERPGSGDVFSLTYTTRTGETRDCEATRARIEFFD